MAAFNDLQSKLERAVRAYLVSAGAGSNDDIHVFEDNRKRTFPLTDLEALEGDPSPQFTGSYELQFQVAVDGKAMSLPGDPNPDAPRINFDTRCAQTDDALLQTDNNQDLALTARLITAAGRALAVPVDDTPAAIQFAKDNADMADFTVQAWYEGKFGRGDARAAGCDWRRIFNFRAVCCCSNVD